MSRTGSRVRGALAAAAALALCAALTACSPAMMRGLLADGSDPGPEIEDSPGLFNSQLADAVEMLLMEVWIGDAGAWDAAFSGNVRTACVDDLGRDAYYFYGSWFTPDGADAPGDRRAAERAMAELGAWLEAEGWSELEDYEFTTESVSVNAIGVSAEKPFVGIDYMQVTYYYEGDYGMEYPHIVVDIDSECLIDDSNGLPSLSA